MRLFVKYVKDAQEDLGGDSGLRPHPRPPRRAECADYGKREKGRHAARRHRLLGHGDAHHRPPPAELDVVLVGAAREPGENRHQLNSASEGLSF